MLDFSTWKFDLRVFESLNFKKRMNTQVGYASQFYAPKMEWSDMSDAYKTLFSLWFIKNPTKLAQIEEGINVVRVLLDQPINPLQPLVLGPCSID